MTGSGSTAKYTINDSTYSHGAAVNDRSFRLMCAQYDEVKLVSMGVKLMPSQTITANWAIKVASVIDRNFSYSEYSAQYTGAMTDTEPQTAESIFNNPGVVVQNYNANKIYPMGRYCYVKDLKEKSDFTDATITYKTTSGASQLGDLKLESWSDERTTFSPCFFYALQANMAPTADSSVTFNYTVEYNFVFRNPKNGVDRFLIKEQVGYLNGSGAKSSTEDESTKEVPAATAAAEEVTRSKTVSLDEATPVTNLK